MRTQAGLCREAPEAQAPLFWVLTHRCRSSRVNSAACSWHSQGLNSASRFPTLLLLPYLPISLGSRAHSGAKLQAPPPEVVELILHEAVTIPQECLIKLLYFCHRMMPCGTTTPPTSCYPPQSSESFTCVLSQVSEEGATWWWLCLLPCWACGEQAPQHGA